MPQRVGCFVVVGRHDAVASFSSSPSPSLSVCGTCSGVWAEEIAPRTENWKRQDEAEDERIKGLFFATYLTQFTRELLQIWTA